MKGWVAAILLAGAVLLRFPPERFGFYPHCPVYEAFGLLCPGCGATRAMAALLRGHVVEAWRWNALFVASLFTLVLYTSLHKRSEWIRPPGWMVLFGMFAIAVFGIARNL